MSQVVQQQVSGQLLGEKEIFAKEALLEMVGEASRGMERKQKGNQMKGDKKWQTKNR